MEPISISRALLEANERLIQAAFPDIEDVNALNESDAIPRLAAVADDLCAAGDIGICYLMRSWQWDGILTMLVDAGFDLGLGGSDYTQRYAAFVLGEADDASAAVPLQAEIIPFRSRSPE